MPWQKITQYISDSRVEVRSKGGNAYPVETPRDWQNTSVYNTLHNIADCGDDRVLWAWVEFDDDTPTLEDTLITRGDYPGAPPWDR